MHTNKRSISTGIALSLALLCADVSADTLQIEAEAFVNSGGTFDDGQPNPVTIYSVSGESAINFINAGDYVEYDISVEGGEYDIEYLVGTSVPSGPSIEVLVNSNGVWQSQGSVNVPLGSWDNFQALTPSHTVTLPAGASVIRLLAVGSTWQWNLESFTLNQVTPITPVGDADGDGVNDDLDQCPNTPSGATVDSNGCEITGGTGGDSFVVEMETYAATGSDDPRAQGVLIGERGFPNDKHTVVDSVQTTDWIDYNINFPTSGNYSIEMLASGQTSHATAILFIDGIQISESPVDTGNQAIFEDFSLADSVFISAGSRTIRVQAGSSTGAFSWLWFGDALSFTSLDGTPILDTDNDGVPDNVDQCPNTPAGATVDATGCEVVVVIDSDNDGVPDSVDQCPNTPAGTTVDATGCEVVVVIDTDNDGVPDSVDQCPNTPAGATVDATGCEVVVVIDSDNDGVPDSVDQCPNTPAGATVDATGCEVVVVIDTDNDGVPDNIDQCPNTPAGVTVDATGCETVSGGFSNGLMYGEVAGAMNITDANPNWERTTTLNQTEDTIKGNTTEIYTGVIYDADGHISFYENIDDSVRLYIDGVLVLSNDSWEDSSQTADLNLNPGTHAFELRIGNADGGSGPVSGIGFGIDVDGGTNFVHPSAISGNIFTSEGVETGNPNTPQDGDIIIQLEDFISTGTNGRVGGDTVEGFGIATGSVNWVTNGDYGDYKVTFTEAGTYRAFITISAESAGSYGARVDINREPVAWGYFAETGSWDVSEEIELYGGHFVVEQTGEVDVRVEAVGGSNWQWSGDQVRFTRVGNVTAVPEAPYDPNDHFVAEVEGPATGALPFLKDPVDIPANRKVLKSDVWYTYPQNRELPGFDDFGATGAFWGHPPEEDFYEEPVILGWAVNVVDAFQSEGFEYTARGEFDWAFRWFTEYTINPEPHFVRSLDDRDVRMTFMGYLSHDGYNNNWLSNHSPAFVPYMKSQVDQILKANPDKLMFDTQTNSTRSTDMNTFGGDFSSYAMENFRIWLDKKYSSAELSAMGVSNISTFDYGEFLRAAGVTHQSFMQAADTISGNVPMLEDFIYFNRDVWNQKFGEVLEYIRQQQPDIEIGASTHLFESRGYIFNENITFLSGELNLGARTTTEVLPTNILVHLKGAEAVDKTLVYFPYPWEFNDLREKDIPRFARGWIAQSYAYGGMFSIPANVWVGGEVFTWFPGADNYRDIYQFVRANETLFDGYTSYAKAGLVHAMYSSMKAGFIDGGNQIQASTKILTEDNINFDLLVFGDEGYPVVPRQDNFDEFEHIFFDGDLNYLTPAQRAVLDAQGSKVRHIGQRGTIDDLNINVSINGAVSNETVSAVSRIHETNAAAPYVIHLINRPFANGVTPMLSGVEVAIPQDYFPDSVSSATLHLPDGTSTVLSVSTNANGDAVVTVDNLEVWGLLELGH